MSAPVVVRPFAVAVEDGRVTRFHCAGVLEKRGAERAACEHLLMRWHRPPGQPPAVSVEFAFTFDTGVVEVKCRRCKTVNEIRIPATVASADATVANNVQHGERLAV